MHRQRGSKRSHWLNLARDRRGSAAIETALLFLPFIILLLLIIETGVYFTLQSSLDAGVLTTSETLRAAMLAGSAFSPPAATALKAMLIANGGVSLGVSVVNVDVRQLTTLSGSAVTIIDGTVDWGGSGSVLIVRAQATMSFLPGTTLVSMTSTSIVRRPWY